MSGTWAAPSAAKAWGRTYLRAPPHRRLIQCTQHYSLNDKDGTPRRVKPALRREGAPARDRAGPKRLEQPAAARAKHKS